MGAAVVDRHQLDVLVGPSAVWFLVLDPDIRKVDLLVEVGQVVGTRPVVDLRRRAIGTPVAITAAGIPLLEESSVFLFQLVVKDDALDACPALLEALRFANVGRIELDIVLHLARLLELGVERLLTSVRVVRALDSMPIQQVSAAIRENDRDVLPAFERHGPDEAVLAEMAQVTLTEIERLAAVVPQIVRRHDPKRPNGRQGAGFRAAEGVMAIAVPDDFALGPAGEPQFLREDVARIAALVAVTAIHWISAGTSTTAEIGTGIVAVAGIVTTTGIV
jgi:hypothetical protein